MAEGETTATGAAGTTATRNRIIDPTTGRPAFSGPQGQPGSGSPIPGYSVWTMPDGTQVWYDPNAAPAPGNTQALGLTAAPAQAPAPTAAAPTQPAPPVTPAAPAPPPVNPDPTGANYSIIQQYLAQMGITDAGASAWAQGLIASGASPQSIEVQMYNQPWFQTRFPGIFQRQKAGLPPISPAEYVGYEDQARQLESAYGFPGGFLDDHSYVGNLIGQDVSMAELQNRVEQGFSVVQQAPQQVRDAFSQMYGPHGDAALASYVLDPSRSVPLLEKQVAAAQFGGQGAIQGFGIGRGTAELAAGLGISQAEARSGFGQLNQIRPFFTPGVGETAVPDINTTGVAAQFGLDQNAQALVAQQESQRRAEFAGGGGGVTTAQGVVGAGAQKPF